MRNINSLKSASEFREAYDKGRSYANRLLVMYVTAADGEGNRLGISVSKKVGNSVVRHRITRIIRECFVKAQPKLKEGYTLVVIARAQAKDRNFSDLYDAFLHLCRKLDCYQ